MCLDLANNDVVIAALVNLARPAVEPGQNPGNYGYLLI